MAKIAILVEKIYEDLELQYPRLRLKEAGHAVDIVGPKAGETYVGKHGYPQKAGKWVDEEVVVDGNIITSRGPDDLPSFSNAILQFVSEGRAEGVKGKPAAP